MSEYSTFKGEKEEATAYCYFFRCTTKSLPFPLLNHDLGYYFPVQGPSESPSPLTQKKLPDVVEFSQTRWLIFGAKSNREEGNLNALRTVQSDHKEKTKNMDSAIEMAKKIHANKQKRGEL